jgi:hypothetical protein
MRTSILALTLLLAAPAIGRSADLSDVEPLMIAGKLQAAETELGEALKKNSNDESARLALGATQYLRSIERFARTLYDFGLRENLGIGALPGGRALPIPKNPNPEKVKLSDLRGALQTWLNDLQKAEATLARVQSPDAKFRLRIGLVRLDVDGDGTTTESDSLRAIYYALPRNAVGDAANVAGHDSSFAFDRADAAWLRGYCHLVMSTLDAILAYDGTELFEKTGHVLFANVDSPYAFLGRADKLWPFGPGGGDAVDFIAMIHLARFPLSEPKRLSSAREHIKSTIALSRTMWTWALEETDDDHEWIPSPKQDTAVPGGKMTDAMISGWHEFLDEAEALLDGRKLLPFWRGDASKGINLKRVLLEPREFDLVLWVQGSAAVPYLEQGTITKPETWRQFQQLFRGNFFGFAIWLN